MTCPACGAAISLANAVQLYWADHDFSRGVAYVSCRQCLAFAQVTFEDAEVEHVSLAGTGADVLRVKEHIAKGPVLAAIRTLSAERRLLLGAEPVEAEVRVALRTVKLTVNATFDDNVSTGYLPGLAWQPLVLMSINRQPRPDQTMFFFEDGGGYFIDLGDGPNTRAKVTLLRGTRMRVLGARSHGLRCEIPEGVCKHPYAATGKSWRPSWRELPGCTISVESVEAD